MSALCARCLSLQEDLSLSRRLNSELQKRCEELHSRLLSAEDSESFAKRLIGENSHLSMRVLELEKELQGYRAKYAACTDDYKSNTAIEKEKSNDATAINSSHSTPCRGASLPSDHNDIRHDSYDNNNDDGGLRAMKRPPALVLDQVSWQIAPRIFRSQLLKSRDTTVNTESIDDAENLVGIGVLLDKDKSKRTITISSILPDGAAAKDGRLKIGDTLREVNGESAVSIFDRIGAAIRGPKDSILELKVQRAMEANLICVRIRRDANAKSAAIAHESIRNLKKHEAEAIHYGSVRSIAIPNMHSNTVSSQLGISASYLSPFKTSNEPDALFLPYEKKATPSEKNSAENIVVFNNAIYNNDPSIKDKGSNTSTNRFDTGQNRYFQREGPSSATSGEQKNASHLWVTPRTSSRITHASPQRVRDSSLPHENVPLSATSNTSSLSARSTASNCSAVSPAYASSRTVSRGNSFSEHSKNPQAPTTTTMQFYPSAFYPQPQYHSHAFSSNHQQQQGVLPLSYSRPGLRGR